MNQSNSSNDVGNNRRLWLPQPFLFVLCVYLGGLVLFALDRITFLIVYRDQVQDAGLFEILTAFPVGVRFDQIIVLYILLPLLLTLPFLSLKNRIVAGVTRDYLTVLTAVVVLTMIVDLRFFHYFGTHLNFLAYQYLGDGDLAWDLILAEPHLWLYLAGWIIVVAVVRHLIGRLIRQVQPAPHHGSWLVQVGLLVVFIALAFLGIRGRVGLAPIDWGAAYFSRNDFVNQLALNGPYTLARNALERGGDLRLATMKESERFPFVTPDEALATVREMLDQPGDLWIAPDSNLQRISHSSRPSLPFRPNLILLIMESWSGSTTGVLGCPYNLTPNYDRLAEQAHLFTNFYASGTRTSYGLSATIASFPSLPGRSIMTRYDAVHPFVTLSELLHERDYYNVFAYGGDMVFDNMQGFLREKRYDRFVGENWFGRENEFSKWGIPDQVVFDKTEYLVDSLPRPFNLTVLSLSNHEPFDLPDSSVQMFFDDADSSRVYNAQRYADFALGRFLDWFQSSPLQDSTILIITADHCRYRAANLMLDPVVFRIPLLIYAPMLWNDSGEVVPTFGSQVDILPTVMGLMGGTYEHESWGRDLFRVPVDSGFATINGSDRIGYIDHLFYYMEHLGRSIKLFNIDVLDDPSADVSSEHPEEFEVMQERVRRYMQAAEDQSTVSLP
ncbi:MAG TPA: LTA synthase family protein [candidate division Zixibacteria bacterium]|nr:LTA synthase family protein [candidate division Zixibacteria bacterium]